MEARPISRAAAAALALAVFLLHTQPAAAIGGKATFYGGKPDGMSPYSASYGTLAGSCGQGLLSKSQWPNWHVMGISTANRYYRSGPSFACGMCFRITCLPHKNRAGACKKSNSMVMQVTDSCPQCAANHFDMQALSFAKIAHAPFGQVNIDYKRVSCTPPGGIIFNVMDNRGGGGWVRFGVQNVAGAGEVKSVYAKSPGTGWHRVSHSWGGVFESGGMPGNGPWSFKVTTVDGKSTICSKVLRAHQTGHIRTRCQIGKSTSAVKKSKTFTSKGCVDKSPGGGFTCAQQKAWGKCGASWMRSYCKRTCGRC